jgi:hypothetical protein
VLDPEAVPDAVRVRPIEVAALAEHFDPTAPAVPVLGRSDSRAAIL